MIERFLLTNLKRVKGYKIRTALLLSMGKVKTPKGRVHHKINGT